jgi:hypothetical protein
MNCRLSPTSRFSAETPASIKLLNRASSAESLGEFWVFVEYLGAAAETTGIRGPGPETALAQGPQPRHRHRGGSECLYNARHKGNGPA